MFSGKPKKYAQFEVMREQEGIEKCVCETPLIKASSSDEFLTRLGNYMRARTEALLKTIGKPYRKIGKLLAFHLYEAAMKWGGWCLEAEGKLPKHLAKAEIRWECKVGHVFKARVDNVRNGGHWCPYCRSPEWTIERVQEFCRQRRFECLSTAEELVNNKSKLLFKCERGHNWRTTLTNITSRKSGCPCCINKGEQYTREVFEELFGLKLPPHYPRWLKRHGNQLQLDCFCHEFNIAIEFQGEQHFKVMPHLKHGPKELKALQRRDAFKRRMCKKHGVRLIEIPYFEKDCFGIEEFKDHVRRHIPQDIVDFALHDVASLKKVQIAMANMRPSLSIF